PSGRSIQAEGIEPDIYVEQGKVEYFKKRSRTTEADLRGHLTKGDKEDVRKEEKRKQIPTDLFSKGGEPEEEEVQDYQLERALDLLRGLYIYHDKEDIAIRAEQ
ncbi:MAG: hypothetical protein KDD76_04225, partial [Rickettsiales bacterium]|nr:hypothetical protein [Rickettsiales bacterium]